MSLRAFTSTLGTKYLVAVTGGVLVFFVFFHMLGNLQIYLGPDALNSYAQTLSNMGALLWVARTGLLIAVLIHIWGIAKLSLRNRAARPQGYGMQQPLLSTFASRHMLLSGTVLLAFVIYHVLHFTVGYTHPEHFQFYDTMGRHDVYSMVVLGFREPIVAIAYIFTMTLLGMHLAHGAASTLRSTGLSGGSLRGFVDVAGRILALIVVAGNVSIPLACIFGLLQPINEVL